MVAILVLDFMYMAFRGLLLKSITSLVFVAAGVVNLIFAKKQKADLKFPIVLCVVLFVPGLNYGADIMKVICCVYAAIISCMLGKALANMLREKTLANVIIFIGCALFFVSDLMLLLNVFAHLRWASFMCLITYYPGQIIIAFGAYVWALRAEKKAESIESVEK